MLQRLLMMRQISAAPCPHPSPPVCMRVKISVRPSGEVWSMASADEKCGRVDCCCCPFRGRRYAFCGCSVRQNAGMKCAPANARVDIRKAI